MYALLTLGAFAASILLQWAWPQFSITTVNKMADLSSRDTPLPAEGTQLNGYHVNSNGDAVNEESKEVPVTDDCNKENDPKAASRDADVTAAVANKDAKAWSVEVAQAPAKKSGFVRESPRLLSGLMKYSLHLFMFIYHSNLVTDTHMGT